MKSAFDLIRQFSARLLLVAVMALSLQAGALASGFMGVGDCPNDVHAYQSVDRSSEAVSSEHGGIGRAHHGAPCKSTCCSVNCSMAVLGVQATIPMPALIAVTHDSSDFQDAQGIDLKGLSRPPKNRLPV